MADGGTGDLSAAGGVALWRAVAERLLADIGAGRHAPGDRLPAEPVLAARLGVSRHTLRRATRALADDGVLRIVQGSGAYVAARPSAFAFGAQTRVVEPLGGARRAAGGRVLSVGEASPDRDAAAALDLAAGAAAWRVEVLRSGDGGPLAIQTSWIPVALCRSLDAKLARTGALDQALALCGHRAPRRLWTRIAARTPDARDGFRLEEPAGRAIILVESLYAGADGTPLELARERFAADRVEFRIDGGANG